MICVTCGHDDGLKLPEMRPMGMVPYLMADWERKLILKMAKEPMAVYRKIRKIFGEKRKWKRDCCLFELGLLTECSGILRLTPKGMVAAQRVAEWEAMQQQAEPKCMRVKGKKPTPLAQAIVAQINKKRARA